MVQSVLLQQAAFFQQLGETARRQLLRHDPEKALARLRGNIVDEMLHEESADIIIRTLNNLAGFGIVHGYDYAQIDWKMLRTCCESENAFRWTVQHMTFYGLLPGTVFSEEDLRVIHNRPANLFAVDGVEELLNMDTEDVFDDTFIMKQLTHLEMADLVWALFRDRGGVSPTLEQMLVSWKDIFSPTHLGTLEENLFIREREQRIGKRVLEVLQANSVLWAPLSFTKEELDHLEHRNVRDTE